MRGNGPLVSLPNTLHPTGTLQIARPPYMRACIHRSLTHDDDNDNNDDDDDDDDDDAAAGTFSALVDDRLQRDKSLDHLSF